MFYPGENMELDLRKMELQRCWLSEEFSVRHLEFRFRGGDVNILGSTSHTAPLPTE
jgi:hypothetical protein